jgi:hypothetical protein
MKVAQALFETAAQTVEYQKHARGQKSHDSGGFVSVRSNFRRLLGG